MSMDAVTAALAAARSSAETAVQALPTVPSVSLPAAAIPAGRVRSLAEAAESYVERPDLFIKVNENGMLIGDEAGFISELFGTINLGEVKLPTVCRYSVAGATKYLRTYDGAREVTTGKAWGQAIAEAQMIDPKASVYDSVEIGIVLLKEPVKTALNKSAALTAVPVGSRVGYTASQTGFDPIMKTLTTAIKQLGMNASINVRAFHIPKSKGNNRWGVVGLEPYTEN